MKSREKKKKKQRKMAVVLVSVRRGEEEKKAARGPTGSARISARVRLISRAIRLPAFCVFLLEPRLKTSGGLI